MEYIVIGGFIYFTASKLANSVSVARKLQHNEQEFNSKGVVQKPGPNTTWDIQYQRDDFQFDVLNIAEGNDLKTVALTTGFGDPFLYANALGGGEEDDLTNEVAVQQIAHVEPSFYNFS